MEADLRPLRADAARNRARVLDAAREAFAELGLDVGVEEIARRLIPDEVLADCRARVRRGETRSASRRAVAVVLATWVIALAVVAVGAGSYPAVVMLGPADDAPVGQGHPLLEAVAEDAAEEGRGGDGVRIGVVVGEDQPAPSVSREGDQDVELLEALESRRGGGWRRVVRHRADVTIAAAQHRSL